MQGLADGYFIIPYTLGNYFAGSKLGKVETGHASFKEAEKAVSAGIQRLLAIKGKRTPADFHKELGALLWDKCGMSRNDKGLKELLAQIPQLREEFWKNVNVTGSGAEFNMTLERAGRVADYLEFAQLLAKDARERRESCGGHFREEYQTEDGEAKRDDNNFSHVAAWEFTGTEGEPILHKEPLEFENVHVAQRSYA